MALLLLPTLLPTLLPSLLRMLMQLQGQAAALRWCDAHEAGAVSLVVLAELDQVLVDSLPEEAAQAVGERLRELRRQLLGLTS